MPCLRFWPFSWLEAPRWSQRAVATCNLGSFLGSVCSSAKLKKNARFLGCSASPPQSGNLVQQKCKIRANAQTRHASVGHILGLQLTWDSWPHVHCSRGLPSRQSFLVFPAIPIILCLQVSQQYHQFQHTKCVPIRGFQTTAQEADAAQGKPLTGPWTTSRSL